MNQEQEERTIRELFRQLRRDDEPSAPPFAASLEAALSRNERADRFRFVRPAAVAIVALLLLGGAWLISSKRSAKPQAQADSAHSGTPAGAPAPNVESPPALESTPPSVTVQAMKSNRHRKKLAQPRLATQLISEWRSPTASLLRTPGEQLLKTVPRLDESLIRIRLFTRDRRRDQQN